MGLFDRLTGRRAPAPGTRTLSPDAVVAAVLGVNAPDAPYSVRQADGSEGADLVAEWRLTEPQWAATFRNTSMDRTFQVLLRLDPAAAEVRTSDRQWKVTWVGDTPRLTLAQEYSRGQRTEVSFSRTVGGDGSTSDYRFSTEELKEPLRRAVTGAGWMWRPVAFGKL